ncbi:MAG: YlqD family protein [Cyanobacteria bacterium P01_E01_bin.6]
MDLGSQLLLKRAINIKVVVTPRWKEEVQAQLQNQINRLDGQLQQLETQGQRAISEVQKKAEGEDPIVAQQVSSQVSSIQNQVNQNKSKILEKKNQALQQLQQVQMLEMDQEVGQGQLESFFTVNQGDNLVKKMQVEILLKDGVIEEIRGDL